MRKLLLASVATLGTGSLMGTAFAQAPAPTQGQIWSPAGGGVVGAPSQGQQVWTPAPAPTAYVNNNNNYQAPALPGALANPTPGTIVIHINGKVSFSAGAIWTSADSRFFTAPAGTPGGAPITPGTTTSGAIVGNAGVNSGLPSAAAVAGANGTGPAKVEPEIFGTFARLYFGADAMATNGLRYGAALEIRDNFTGNYSGQSPSTYSSTETLFMRRAFVYVAGENWGIVRMGQADGMIGIFDNGVTTTQFNPTGQFNGGDVQSFMPGNVPPTYIWMSQAGADYDNTKVVYLSPQIAGFDFGLQYAPNNSNGYGSSSAGLGGLSPGAFATSGVGTGIVCATATSGCPNTSAGPGTLDGSRILNQAAVGVRYQGVFGGLGVLAYGVWEFSGHAQYTGATAATAVGRANLGVTALPGSTYTGNYNGLNIGSGGVALTWAGFTVAANAIGGQKNGYMNLAPQGAVPQVGFLVGVKYVTGPLTVGTSAMEYWDQGNVQMTGLTQHRARGIEFGGVYTVAPGYQVFGEYLWNDQTQHGVNQLTGATGSNANNNIRGQGIVIGNVVNF
jgi:hypothetical protein